MISLISAFTFASSIASGTYSIPITWRAWRETKLAIFYAGDMKDMLTQDFINQHGRPDVIITDPPRAGMHQDVIDVILFAEPKRIVYVSCNPATQARDLQLLDEKYKVKAVQPVDMFPHTHHRLHRLAQIIIISNKNLC